MNFIKTNINDVYVIEPKSFVDQRGCFFETYNKKEFEKNGLIYNFVQDNQTESIKGVLRGLHYQKEHPQAKLIQVIEGEVFDVIVDLRKKSSTFGMWFGIILSSTNKKMLLIPRGFAHGLLILSDYAKFSYKCDDFYHAEDENGIKWNDPFIDIKWPCIDSDFILSDKDKIRLPFSKFGEYF